MKTKKKMILTVIVLLLVRVDFAFSQASVSTAEMRGQVTDQAGAAVAGATVTVTDPAKGVSRSATTDENGNFIILALQPSIYNMKVEATGFATRSFSDIKLDVGQVASFPVQLATGGVQAAISVAATGEAIEVERTAQSSVISDRQITNLPINRRNYLDFALLTPGVTDSDSINDSSDFRVAQTPQSGLSFGGNNGRGNSILVDGASADTNSGAARDVISQEGVQEFQVNRNSYNAEFGGASGGIVNIVSKTGSNAFHGSLFGYFRDDRFDARNAFDFTPAGKAPFDRQQYGGSLGGPVSQDKTFFFTSVERLSETRTTFVNLLNDPNIFNITASQSALFGFLDGASVPAAFRAISAGLRSALTTTQAAYPRTISLFQNASGQFPFETNSTLFSARLDHSFNSKDSGYARFNLGKSRFENNAAGALTAVSRGRTAKAFTGGGLLSETHFFSPTTLNELKAQYSYLASDFIPNDLIGPEFNIEGFGNFGRDIFLPSEAIERRYEVSDNIATVKGNHTLKVGGQFQAIDTSANSQTFFGGRFNFGNALPLSNIIALNPALGPAVLTQLNTFIRANGGALGADANGNGLADPLDAVINALQSFNLNLPIVYQQGFGESGFNYWTHRYHVYGQDIWKIRPNFTLTYGARYFLDNPQFFGESDRNNIQPRVGFSWLPWKDGKTVVRGGYGIYTGQVDGQIVNVVNELNGRGTPSNINIVLATATSGALGLPTSFAVYQRLLSQGIIGSRTIVASDLAQFGVTPGPGKPLEVRFRREPNFENPYSEQASLAVQRDLGAGYLVEVSYLFNRSAHVTRNRDINQFKRTGPPSPLNPKGGPTFIRFPSAAQVAAGLTSDFRNPLLFQDNVYESSASSFYHAGTVQLSKRLAHHYSINANYTYAKAIDEVTDFNSDFSAQNPLNLRLDRALSAFDQRQRLVVYGVVESPIKGESIAEKIFSDWLLSGIYVAGSGRPFNLLLGIDANADGRSQSDRPGQAARNSARGEPFHQVDMRLGRRFNVGTERRYLEFTFEAFNLFNKTNYTGINNIVGCGAVGTLGSYCAGQGRPVIEDFNARGIKGLAPTQPLGFTSSAPARQLQFGARFNF
jgi:hypothetical protein